MKPILFSTPMVQAILAGKKTMTRRIIPEKIIYDYYDYDDWCNAVTPRNVPCTREYEYSFFKNRARYQPGDILWVRETWCKHQEYYNNGADVFPEPHFIFKADGVKADKWKPSIFMPREAARIFLRVKDINVERVQDITEEDAVKEGFQPIFDDIKREADFPTICESAVFISAKGKFRVLWDQLNSKRGYGWHDNPWVWVIEFERIEFSEGEHF